jgi:hypothetical protein
VFCPKCGRLEGAGVMCEDCFGEWLAGAQERARCVNDEHPLEG